MNATKLAHSMLSLKTMQVTISLMRLQTDPEEFERNRIVALKNFAVMVDEYSHLFLNN